MRIGECFHVIIHFADYDEAKAVLDAASLDEKRMWKIELQDRPRPRGTMTPYLFRPTDQSLRAKVTRCNITD